MAKSSSNNGFLIVATKQLGYYKSAINLANSILDFMPDAKITLFVGDDLYNKKDAHLFDNVVVLDNDTQYPLEIKKDGPLLVKDSNRAKLYALSRTPYKITAYLDADCEVRHEDISTIFDQIGDADIMLTKIRSYSGADLKVTSDGKELLYWHCGVFLYKNKKKVLEFMEDWWIEYNTQRRSEPWPYAPHREAMRQWDQYAFYRLYNSDKYKSLKLDVFPGEDARWNYVWNYTSDEVTKPPIIFHYTLDVRKLSANYRN